MILFSILTGTMIAPLVVLYGLSLLGFNHMALFFAFIFMALIFAGTSFIPGTLLAMETIDYALYKTGKGMQDINQALGKMNEKAQAAIAGTATGAVLIAVGYVVNEAGDYVGTEPVRSLLAGLLMVCCLIPAILQLLSALLLGTLYPLNGKVREEMYAELNRRRAVNTHLASTSNSPPTLLRPNLEQGVIE